MATPLITAKKGSHSQWSGLPVELGQEPGQGGCWSVVQAVEVLVRLGPGAEWRVGDLIEGHSATICYHKE